TAATRASAGSSDRRGRRLPSVPRAAIGAANPAETAVLTCSVAVAQYGSTRPAACSAVSVVPTAAAAARHVALARQASARPRAPFAEELQAVIAPPSSAQANPIARATPSGSPPIKPKVTAAAAPSAP